MKTIGITLGDPAGVGPEVLTKGLPYLSKARARFILFGDENLILSEIAKRNLDLPRNVSIYSLSKLRVFPGQPTEETHLASIKYLETAINLVKRGDIQAIVTLPINKEAFAVARLPFRGHTEFLAKALNCQDYAMAFYGKKLSLSLVTTHIPFTEVKKSLSQLKILKVAKLSFEFLKRIKPERSEYKIALCALNPHAGEGGLLGEEEEKILKPAIVEAKRQGIPLYGPYPSDSLFYWCLQGKFDFVIALYHDQGLIPFKMLHFRDGVNITLGLPIIRTSPVHGTAYDIAGKDLADPSSFVSAVKLALKLLTKTPH